MSTLPLALFVQLAAACPGQVTTDLMRAGAMVESGFQTTAIHDNETGRSYAPESDAAAVTLARSLLAKGHRIDAGVMQITDANWPRLGLSVESVFDPRENICAGKAVLVEAYAIERRALCRYNTGKPDCSNGYPERVQSVLARLKASGSTPVSAPAAPAPAAPEEVVIWRTTTTTEAPSQ